MGRPPAAPEQGVPPGPHAPPRPPAAGPPAREYPPTRFQQSPLPPEAVPENRDVEPPDPYWEPEPREHYRAPEPPRSDHRDPEPREPEPPRRRRAPEPPREHYRDREPRFRGPSADGIGRTIQVLTGLISLAFVLHIIFVVAGANHDSGFVGFVYSVSKFFVFGLGDVFTPGDPTIGVVLNYGLAALIYLVLGRIIARALRR